MSIPARAGEPARYAGRTRTAGVYPRACGGASHQNAKMTICYCLSPRVRGSPRYVLLVGSRDKGLSPRVRGSRERAGRHAPWRRSIPARAGEPASAGGDMRQETVYPRACGGAGAVLKLNWHSFGLSPRVRGSPFRQPIRPSRQRSIPARAGEPG